MKWKSLFSVKSLRWAKSESLDVSGIRKSKELLPLSHPTEFQLFRGKASDIPRKILLLLSLTSSPGGAGGELRHYPHTSYCCSTTLGSYPILQSTSRNKGGFIDSKRANCRVPSGKQPNPEQILPFTSQFSPQNSSKCWGEDLPPFSLQGMEFPFPLAACTANRLFPRKSRDMDGVSCSHVPSAPFNSQGTVNAQRLQVKCKGSVMDNNSNPSGLVSKDQSGA